MNDVNMHPWILEQKPKNLEAVLKSTFGLGASEKVTDPFTSEITTKMNKGVVGVRRETGGICLSEKMDQLYQVVKDLKQDDASCHSQYALEIKDVLSELKSPNESENRSNCTDQKFLRRLVSIDCMKQEKERALQEANHLSRRPRFHYKQRHDTCLLHRKMKHCVRECQNQSTPTSSDANFDDKMNEMKVFVASPQKFVSETYVTIQVGREEHQALLDTGCTRSCIARKFVPAVPLTPSKEKLYAANGTPIVTFGTFCLIFKIGHLETVADLQVCEGLDDMILGMDWLTQNKCRWDFGNKMLGFRGEWVPLKQRVVQRVKRTSGVPEVPKGNVGEPVTRTNGIPGAPSKTVSKTNGLHGVVRGRAAKRRARRKALILRKKGSELVAMETSLASEGVKSLKPPAIPKGEILTKSPETE